MRIIKLMLLVSLLGGCASLQGKKEEPLRNYPLYLAGNASSAAFKIEASHKGKTINAVLLLTEVLPDKKYKVKVVGDYASVLFDGFFENNRLSVNYSLGDMAQGDALEAFSETLMIMLSKPSVFLNASSSGADRRLTFTEGNYLYRYYFKKGLSFPYKAEQIKGVIIKKFFFEDYTVYGERSLPSVVIIEGALSSFTVKLSLLSVK